MDTIRRAIEAAEDALVLDYHGQHVEGRFRYVRTWKRRGDAWTIVAGAVMPAA